MERTTLRIKPLFWKENSIFHQNPLFKENLSSNRKKTHQKNFFSEKNNLFSQRTTFFWYKKLTQKPPLRKVFFFWNPLSFWNYVFVLKKKTSTKILVKFLPLRKNTLEKKEPPCEKNENTSFEMKTHHNSIKKTLKKTSHPKKKSLSKLWESQNHTHPHPACSHVLVSSWIDYATICGSSWAVRKTRIHPQMHLTHETLLTW